MGSIFPNNDGGYYRVIYEFKNGDQARIDPSEGMSLDRAIYELKNLAERAGNEMAWVQIERTD